MIVITESRQPQPGQQHSYTMHPPPRPGCKVYWFINRKNVTVHDETGGLKVVGIGASGTITVEVTGDFEETVIHVMMICEGQEENPELGGPLTVGRGSSDPCPEPCKGFRQNYSDQLIRALKAKEKLAGPCLRYKTLVAQFFALLLLLFFVFAAIVMCHALHWVPIVCAGLYALASLLAVLIVLCSTIIIISQKELKTLTLFCELERLKMEIAYAEMQINCPPPCWLPKNSTDCGCK